VEAIVTVQRAIVEHTPALAPALIPPPRLHISLAMVTLATLCGEAEEAKALQWGFQRFRQLGTKPFLVRFQGMGAFGGGRVVFAKPLEEPNLRRLAEALSDGSTGRPWTPHVTVAKVRTRRDDSLRLPREDATLRVIPAPSYERFMGTVLGEERFSEFVLCRMVGSGVGGDYPVVGSIPF